MHSPGQGRTFGLKECSKKEGMTSQFKYAHLAVDIVACKVHAALLEQRDVFGIEAETAMVLLDDLDCAVDSSDARIPLEEDGGAGFN